MLRTDWKRNAEGLGRCWRREVEAICAGNTLYIDVYILTKVVKITIGQEGKSQNYGNGKGCYLRN